MPEFGYDVGAIAREIQAQYLRDAAGNLTNEHLHPRALMVLVDELEVFTDNLLDQAKDRPIDAFDAWGGSTVFGSFEVKTARDMVRWRERLEGYRLALENCIAAPGMDELVACALVPVTEPLVLGFMPDKKVQTVPDFVTPFMLANALGVRRDLADAAWQRFLDDMASSWPVEAAGKTWDIMAEFSPVALLVDIARGRGPSLWLIGGGLVAAGYVFRRPLSRLLCL